MLKATLLPFFPPCVAFLYAPMVQKPTEMTTGRGDHLSRPASATESVNTHKYQKPIIKIVKPPQNLLSPKSGSVYDPAVVLRFLRWGGWPSLSVKGERLLRGVMVKPGRQGLVSECREWMSE